MLGFLTWTWSLVRAYRRLAGMVGLSIIAWAAFQAFFPLSLGLIIDRAIVPRDPSALTRILATLVVGFAAFAGLVLLGDRMHVRLTSNVLNDVRLSMFRHLQGLSIDFHARTRPGDVASRFSADLADIEYAWTYTLHYGLAALLTSAAAISLLFTLEPRLAVLAVAGLPLVLLGPRLIGRSAQEANLANKRELGALNDMVGENLQAQQMLKAFGLERNAIDAFRLRLQAMSGFGIRAHFLSSMMERVPTLTVTAFNVTVTCVGAWLAFRGVLSLGELVAFAAMFGMLSDAVTTIMWALPFLVRAAAARERIDEILGETAAVVDPVDVVAIPSPAREMSVHEVTFGYKGAEPILDKLSLTIPPGAALAIVGTSGSGKSTLLRLLLRMYDPWSGSVRIEGIDLRSIKQADLRARFGVVLQEPFLFNTSISENMRLVRPHATDDEIESVARAAEVHDAIMALPDGYATLVGDRGAHLSPGQRQRVALARALLRDPDILFLDEATSALDAATELAVNRTVERLSGERTVISVTHRLASVVKADIVVVMDKGRIVGQGTHRELLADNAIYHELWEKQHRFMVRAGGQLDADALREIRIFERLDESSLRVIGLLMAIEEHPAYSEVVTEGDAGDKLFLIARGVVEVFRAGREKEPDHVLTEGDHFGEIALLDGTPASASVRTRVPTTMLTLNRDAFRSLLAADDSIREAIEATARARRRS